MLSSNITHPLQPLTMIYHKSVGPYLNRYTLIIDNKKIIKNLNANKIQITDTPSSKVNENSTNILAI